SSRDFVDAASRRAQVWGKSPLADAEGLERRPGIAPAWAGGSFFRSLRIALMTPSAMVHPDRGI
ncbi:MAG TPA: hypothetical protein VEQ85_16080, partial [Lacipirellulaceae bacterium]|nr:hypothetical protein [Lacipirellulaceae bacterium]